jgi:hypothetical protein
MCFLVPLLARKRRSDRLSVECLFSTGVVGMKRCLFFLAVLLMSPIYAGRLDEPKSNSESVQNVKLVLSDGLYRQQTRTELLQARLNLGQAIVNLTHVMTIFELMRSEFGCYLQEFSGALDQEITEGLDGVSVEEFSRRADLVSSKTKVAYHKAVCNKVYALLSGLIDA